MNAASIIVIAIIIICSVLAVLTAEEPLDETFHVEAAMRGFPLQPLATKTSSRSDNARFASAPFKSAVPSTAQVEDAASTSDQRRSGTPKRAEGVRLPRLA